MVSREQEKHPSPYIMMGAMFFLPQFGNRNPLGRIWNPPERGLSENEDWDVSFYVSKNNQ